MKFSRKSFIQSFKQHIQMLPIIIGVWIGTYLVSVYVGWREPIKDFTQYTSVYIGAIIGYIGVCFIKAYLDCKNHCNQ